MVPGVPFVMILSVTLMLQSFAGNSDCLEVWENRSCLCFNDEKLMRAD